MTFLSKTISSPSVSALAFLFLAFFASVDAFAVPSYVPVPLPEPTMPQGVFAPSPEGDFFNQDLIRIKAVPNAINGIDSSGRPERGPLLLVNTIPKGMDRNQQGVLWGFRVCQGPVELIFAVSLGAGVNSQSPTIDVKDGVIAVGRIVNSIALIDIKNAILGSRSWIKDTEMLRLLTSPAGANQKAIFQSFYAADPVTIQPNHHGVALLPLPPEQQSSGMTFAVSVGCNEPIVRGIPNSVLTNQHPTIWSPQPAFIKGTNQTDEKIDFRAIPHQLNGLAFKKQGLIENLTITKDGEPRQANVLVAVTTLTNEVYFFDQSNPREPLNADGQNKVLGKWKAPGTIAHIQPCIDATTNYIAVPVETPGNAREATWYVLNIQNPENPTVIAELPYMGRWGAMTYGILYTGGNGKLMAVDLLNTVQNAGKDTRLNSMLNCVPPTAKISIDLITFNQGVERHLEKNNLDNDYKIGLTTLDKYKNNPELIEEHYKWKYDVPYVGGRPTIFRVYASKTCKEAIPPVSISLEITAPSKTNPGQIEKLEIVADKTNVALTNEKGTFGDVGHENMFTFTLTQKEQFKLLGPDTKIMIVVEAVNNDTDKRVTEHEIYNAYKLPTNVRFDYSLPVTIDLIPVDWITQQSERIWLTDTELDEFKYELEKNIRAIMPITIYDGTNQEYLFVNRTSNEEITPGQLRASNGNTFDRPYESATTTEPYPQLDNLLPTLVDRHCSLDGTYNIDQPNDLEIFKLFLLKAEPGKTYDNNTAVIVEGVGANYTHNSIFYAKFGSNYSRTISTAMHELGHNLGSRHAPVCNIYNSGGEDSENDFWRLETVDAEWYENLHLSDGNFSSSFYYFGRIGVTGHLFDLNMNNSGADIMTSWRNDSNRDISMTNRDIMGYYKPTNEIWISDRTFTQWFKHLNSRKNIDDRYPQKPKIIEPPEEE